MTALIVTYVAINQGSKPLTSMDVVFTSMMRVKGKLY